MKTQILNTVTLYHILVLTFVIPACRTKQLNTQMTRTSNRQAEETTITSKQNEWFQGNRIISMSDSGNHQYRINIFPLDTFSFSMEGGFKGKASAIEIIGSARQVKQVHDSSSFIAKQQSETQFDLKSKSRETAVSNVNSLEKSKAGRIGIFMWIGLAGLLGWVVWKFWNPKTHKNVP